MTTLGHRAQVSGVVNPSTLSPELKGAAHLEQQQPALQRLPDRLRGRPRASQRSRQRFQQLPRVRAPLLPHVLVQPARHLRHPRPVFDIVTGEPFKQSAELTGEPIKMKG